MSSKEREQAIENLHMIFMKNMCLSALLGFVVSYPINWLLSLKEDIKNNWVLGAIITILTAIVALYFNKYSKNKIANQINTIKEGLYTQKDFDKLIEDHDRKIKTLEETNRNDSEIRNKQLVSNFVRLNKADSALSENMIRQNRFLRECELNEENFLSNAKKDYTDAESTKKLCAVIKTIKKESWRQFATISACEALDCKKDNRNQLNEEPGKFLRLDIYVYLYAWLVNSIDNIAMGIKPPYMPIKYIQPRYGTPEKSPDIEKYDKAFKYLIKLFDEGTFATYPDYKTFDKEEIDI